MNEELIIDKFGSDTYELQSVSYTLYGNAAYAKNEQFDDDKHEEEA